MTTTPPMTGERRLQPKVLTSFEEIEAIRGTWSALQWHPNADIDFYSLIVGVRAEVIRPYVLVVSDDTGPIALLVARLEDGQLELKAGYKVLWRPKVRRLTVLYGGFMGEREARVSELMVRQLLASLRDEKADLLSWSGVQTPSELREILHRAPGVLCRDYLARSSEHWRMKMPASLDEFLEKRMNKKHRYWAKRLMRMLEKDFPGQVRYECFSKPDQMDTLFADTVRVAKKTYQWGLGVGFQDIPENRERLKLAAERGWLRAYLLYLKNEPVAFWLCTVYGDTVHLDFTGYDPELRKYEVGTALFLHMLGDMAQQRVENLDFGLGSASYKERFGDSSFSESVVCAFASSGRGVFLSVLRLVLQGPAELMRGLLLRLNLEQKAKRLWRTYVTPVRSEKQPSTAEL